MTESVGVIVIVRLIRELRLLESKVSSKIINLTTANDKKQNSKKRTPKIFGFKNLNKSNYKGRQKLQQKFSANL